MLRAALLILAMASVYSLPAVPGVSVPKMAEMRCGSSVS